MASMTAPGMQDEGGGKTAGVVSARGRWARGARVCCGVAALAVAVLVAVGCGERAEGAQPAALTNFTVGISASSSPAGITTGPDGNLWFAEQGGNRIGRITPQGVVTEFSEGISAGAYPSAITTGPDGNLWFTETGGTPPPGSRVGRITPAGLVTEFSEGITPGSAPASITTGPDGNLWFTEIVAKRIGRITPTGTVTEFPADVAYVRSGGIAAGPDGNLWFTASDDRIGRISPAGTVDYFPTPGRGPSAITTGPDGNLWFTAFSGGTPPSAIGRITPLGVVLPEFTAGITYAPFGITTGSDGNVWFSAGPTVGRVTPSGVVTEFSVGYFDQQGGITAGPDGNIWFTEGLANRIVRLVPPPPGSPAPSTSGLPTPALGTLPPPPTPSPAKTSRTSITVRSSGPRTVKRGGRATFVYRVTNPTAKSLARVVLDNTLPQGLSIDGTSRRANQKVAKTSLRFTGAGRKVTFRLGTIGARTTVVVRVNAKVAARAARGRRINTVVFWDRGFTIRASTVTSPVTIK